MCRHTCTAPIHCLCNRCLRPQLKSRQHRASSLHPTGKGEIVPLFYLSATELRTGSPIAVSLVRAREAETLPRRQGTRTGEEPGHRPSPTRKARLAVHLRIVHGARLDASPCSQVLRGSLLTVGQERVVTRGVPAHEHLLLLRSSVRVGTSEVRRGLRRRQGNCTHKQKQRRQQREAGKSMRRQLTVGDRAHKRRTHRGRQHVSE